MEKKMSSAAVARALGLSPTTVSRALSGKGRVSQQTQQQVLDYVRAHGGVRRREPEARPQSHNLALVIPPEFVTKDLPFLCKCMGGICRMAARRDYDLLLCFADSKHPQGLERQLAAQKVDGAILFRAQSGDACLDALRQHQVPYVLVGNDGDRTSMQVDSDHAAAAQEMTRLLLRAGFTRIAYLGGNLDYAVNAQRLSGYRLALQRNRVMEAPELICTGVDNEERLAHALTQILAHDPQCLLCGDDHLTCRALEWLHQAGVRVPEQLRLASLYDSAQLQNADPPVSAVHIDPDSLGMAACRMLLTTLEGRPVERKSMQGYRIFMRRSTQ